MQAVAVGRGIDRYGLDPHFTRGAYDTQRNLPAVRYKYFFKHDVELKSKKLKVKM
jgi:hypothetical protein